MKYNINFASPKSRKHGRPDTIAGRRLDASGGLCDRLFSLEIPWRPFTTCGALLSLSRSHGAHHGTLTPFNLRFAFHLLPFRALTYQNNNPRLATTSFKLVPVLVKAPSMHIVQPADTTLRLFSLGEPFLTGCTAPPTLSSSTHDLRPTFRVGT